MKPFLRLRSLKSDQQGAALTEFAMAAPVFIFMMMGAYDVTYSVYARSVLDGAVQKAGRESALETAALSLSAIDTSLTRAIKEIAPNAAVTISRQSYYKFSDLSRTEVLTDSNANGRCDPGESYEDENNNSVWDRDVGESGIGGPKDIVLLSATMTYDNIFPFYTLAGGSNQTTLTAKTILKNQPYGDQGAPNTSIARVCT